MTEEEGVQRETHIFDETGKEVEIKSQEEKLVLPPEEESLTSKCEKLFDVVFDGWLKKKQAEFEKKE